ncbi:GNAT family N-acetyltransferase [Streptomyces chryseus]
METELSPSQNTARLDGQPSDSNGALQSSPCPFKVVTRPAVTPTLRKKLVATWVEVTNSGGAGIGFLPSVSPEQVKPALADLARKVARDEARLITAESRSTVVGWLAVVLNRDDTQSHWAWLKRMHVLPAMRSLGVGTAMLDAALHFCQSEGLRQLYLTTDGQTGPVGFYRKRGFAEVGRMPRNTLASDGSFHDEVYMVCELPSPLPPAGRAHGTP